MAQPRLLRALRRYGSTPHPLDVRRVLLEAADGVLGITDVAGHRTRVVQEIFLRVCRACRLHYVVLSWHLTDGHTQCGEAW